METTDKKSCRLIADGLVAFGVTDVVVSPGSRNAPLILAVSRHEGLNVHVAIDERSAAFIGLGIALQTKRLVVLICTSGSAVLNYAPALSEALYRHIPLVAISADRPVEWLDQDESQTIHQYGALSAVVKASYDMDVDMNDVSIARKLHANRILNDALAFAKMTPVGPVHINVHLDDPLGSLVDVSESNYRLINTVENEAERPTSAVVEKMSREIMSKRTMVLAGFGIPDKRLDEALSEFVRRSGAVLLHEAESNVSVSPSVANIDACISVMNAEDCRCLAPELVITIGGSTVSRMIKKYLRSISGIEQWYIGCSSNSINSLLSLSTNIKCDPKIFFERINEFLPQCESKTCSFADNWYKKSAEAKLKTAKFLTEVQWSDFYAVGRLMEFIPRNWNLQFSNGTAIRYAQLFDYTAFRRIDCNRGVSGIDGSTSTAIGSHIHYNDVTLLITGDMSAQYDIGAFASTEITPRFKIAVLNNGGGGIFRFIKSTSQLVERERYFAGGVRLPLRQLAEGYGFAYFEADGQEAYDTAIMKFITETQRPAILNIDTSGSDSAALLRKYFRLDGVS